MNKYRAEVWDVIHKAIKALPFKRKEKKVLIYNSKGGLIYEKN